MVLLRSDDRRIPSRTWSSFIARCTVSCISVFLTQLALCAVPLFFPASSLLLQLALSAPLLLLVLGFGGLLRKLLGAKSSAPGFVFFSIVFIWCVYAVVIRKAISWFLDLMFNAEVILLIIIGLHRIMSNDPGYVADESSSSSNRLEDASDVEVEVFLERRVRYCKICKANVKGFDHHCPAFGNCIGQKNHVLFMVLLLGILITEASYIVCASQYLHAVSRKPQPLEGYLLTLRVCDGSSYFS